MLAAYIDGNSTENEKLLIESVMSEDSMLSEVLEIVNDANSLSMDLDWNLFTYNSEFSGLTMPQIPNEEDFPNLNMEDNFLDSINDKTDVDMGNSISNQTFSSININENGVIYGENPQNQFSDDTLQHFGDTCAIKSQQIILSDFGINISEEELREEAMKMGWYAPGCGTPMSDVGNLLALHGVDCHQIENGNVFTLLNELCQGHKVIVGVDSGELWKEGFWGQLREAIEDKIPFIGGADHALIVSGINAEDPNNVKIIITDPGTGDLCKEYPIDQFVDAAQDSNFFMVTTEEPTPHVFDSLDNPNVEHLPYIGHMTFEEFHSHFVDQDCPSAKTFLTAWSEDDYFLAENNSDDDTENSVTESMDTSFCHNDESFSNTTFGDSFENTYHEPIDFDFEIDSSDEDDF